MVLSEQKVFTLKINIPDLDKYQANTDPCTLSYRSELTINHEKEEVLLKIFYPVKEDLVHKLFGYNKNRENNLLKQFEVAEIHEPDNLGGIDFSDFRYFRMTNGSNDIGKFTPDGPEFKFTVLTLTGIRLKYNDLGDGPSFFYLNNAGFPLVEINYNYNIEDPFGTEPYKWEPKNLIKDYIKFNKIEFFPEHSFYGKTKYEDTTVSIHKEPRLLVAHDKLIEVDVRKHVSMVCALFSFYANAEVEYFVSHTYSTDGRFFERRKEKKIETDGHGIFMHQFNRNPLNLINAVRAEHLMGNYDFVMNIIRRYVYAVQLSGESKFMILYNVLEQLRVKYINEGLIDKDKAGDPPKANKVKEEFEFNFDSKTKTNEAIADNLELLVQYVKTDQQNDFKADIKNKISGVKLMTMANQFKSLFDHTKIDPSVCGLDFDKVKDIRNKLFHGNALPEDLAEYLEKISSGDRFPKFVGIMMLKYFGIDDIEKVNRKYR